MTVAAIVGAKDSRIQVNNVSNKRNNVTKYEVDSAGVRDLGPCDFGSKTRVRCGVESSRLLQEDTINGSCPPALSNNQINSETNY
ncbi:MAG: hypothetical protein ACK55I_06680 [bacterium]